VSRAEPQKTAPPLREEAPVAARQSAMAVLTSAALAVLMFATALAVAVAAAYAIWTQVPKQLHVRTDIVGFPIYSNFNSYLHFWRYWLLAAFVPPATLVLFLLLSRVIPGGNAWRGPRARRPAAEPPAPEPTYRQLVATGIGRTLFVGAVFGLEVATVAFPESSWILLVGVPVTAGYALLATLGAIALGRVGRAPDDFWRRLALVNIAAIPLCFAALYAVSRSTQVTLEVTGEVREYSWLPGWLAAGGTAALFAWAISGAVRTRGTAKLLAHERRLLLIVAAPVALLLFLAALPGAWAPMDMFHEGEPLAGARLTQEGAFPWRDLIFIHGFLSDVLFPQLGFTLFEDSRWGFVAGTVVVLVPLYWVSVYYLCAYLFHRNWLFLVGTQVAVILGVVFDAQLRFALSPLAVRFVLLPLALLLLAALFSKPSLLRAAAFMGVVFIQAVVTPEAGIAAVALLATVLLFDLCYYSRARPLLQNFRRTVLCVAFGAAFSVVWSAFLAGFGALDDFVFVYMTFASDHELTGAFPIEWVNDRFVFEAVAPVVLVVLAIWYFGIQVMRGRSLTVADWTMGALAIFVGLYYHKFLARPDLPHAHESFAPAVPLVFYVLYRVIALVGKGVGRVRPRLGAPARLAATALAVTVLLVEAPLSLGDVVADAPTRLEVTLPGPPRVPAVGFVFGADYVDLERGLKTILDTYTGPSDAIFDFTNNPGLFYYLLDRPSPTRYYHVSMAIRADTQDDLVKELKRRPPKLVIYSGAFTGLQAWDGISNQVRHYGVSRYLLDHYRPLAKWNGYVFMGLKGVQFPPASAFSGKVSGPVQTKGLYSRTQPCDWGYAPNFFAEEPSDEARAHPLPLRATRLSALQGWAVDPGAKAPVAAVLAAIDGKVVAQAPPTGRRPDIAALFKSRAYLDAGYQLGVPLPLTSGESLWRARVYGLSRSGRASELLYGPAAPAGLRRGPGPRSLLLNGRRIPVVEGAARGFVDSVVFPNHLVALDVPPATRLARYNWLEIESGSPLRENSFTVTDLPSDIDHGVYFKTLARGEKHLRVDVGACSQWHGYRARRLYLVAAESEAIRAVRLYR
jgi:hypothetical protein